MSEILSTKSELSKKSRNRLATLGMISFLKMLFMDNFAHAGKLRVCLRVASLIIYRFTSWKYLCTI